MRIRSPGSRVKLSVRFGPDLAVTARPIPPRLGSQGFAIHEPLFYASTQACSLPAGKGLDTGIVCPDASGMRDLSVLQLLHPRNLVEIDVFKRLNPKPQSIVIGSSRTQSNAEAETRAAHSGDTPSLISTAPPISRAPPFAAAPLPVPPDPVLSPSGASSTPAPLAAVPVAGTQQQNPPNPPCLSLAPPPQAPQPIARQRQPPPSPPDECKGDEGEVSRSTERPVGSGRARQRRAARSRRRAELQTSMASNDAVADPLPLRASNCHTPTMPAEMSKNRITTTSAPSSTAESQSQSEIEIESYREYEREIDQSENDGREDMEREEEERELRMRKEIARLEEDMDLEEEAAFLSELAVTAGTMGSFAALISPSYCHGKGLAPPSPETRTSSPKNENRNSSSHRSSHLCPSTAGRIHPAWTAELPSVPGRIVLG